MSSKAPAERRRHIVREIAAIAFMIVGMTAARSSLADHYIVPTGSMEPTLVPGDRVVVDKRAYGLRVPYTLERLTGGTHPERGDVVIFDSPDDGTRLIKRVVAIGGDTVAVHEGRVFIDGAPLADGDVEVFGARSAHLDLARGGGIDLPPTRVPDGTVLVLGDARGNSRDGRYFGFVDESAIYARAMGVFWRDGDGFGWRDL